MSTHHLIGIASGKLTHEACLQRRLVTGNVCSHCVLLCQVNFRKRSLPDIGCCLRKPLRVLNTTGPVLGMNLRCSTLIEVSMPLVLALTLRLREIRDI